MIDATLEALKRLRPIADGAGLSMVRVYHAIKYLVVEVAPRSWRDPPRGDES